MSCVNVIICDLNTIGIAKSKKLTVGKYAEKKLGKFLGVMVLKGNIVQATYRLGILVVHRQMSWAAVALNDAMRSRVPGSEKFQLNGPFVVVHHMGERR